MKLLLDQIPSAEEPPVHAPTLPRSNQDIWFVDHSITRRSFVQLGIAAATGVGLAVLGLLPTAKPAKGSHLGSDGYQIKELPCPSYATTQNHGCSSQAPYYGCGPSTVYGESCQADQANHHFGWHKQGQCGWALRKNECTSSGHDGWKWDPGNCGGCCPVVYRCHDGVKRNASCNFLDKSICRWVVTCGSC